MGFIPHLGFIYCTWDILTSVWDKLPYPLADCRISDISEVTKSQRNRRLQHRRQIFRKILYSKHGKLMQCSGFISSEAVK